jgi:Ricin-type beta-trefoil lectin domain
MQTTPSRCLTALPAALGLLAASASADVFVTAYAHGMCLGNTAGVADIAYCGNDTKRAFSGYGAIVLNGACLRIDSEKPDGALKKESCLVRASKRSEDARMQMISAIDRDLSTLVVAAATPRPRPLAAPPPPPPAAAAASAPAPLLAGPCADPWVNDTVARTLNRPARGSGKSAGECDTSRYGYGSWSDYADLLRKTQTAYGTCSDRWVSAAIWEALGRAPQGSGSNNGDCNHARYNNGSWSSYDVLVNMVRLAASTPVTSPTAPVVTTRSISIRSTHAPGKCLDASANQGILLWDCHGGTNQRFSQEADGSIKYNDQCLATSGNTLRFESCAGSGAIHQKWRVINGAAQNGNVPPSCLDIEGGSRNSGARLLAWACHGGGNQQWSFAQ